MTSSRFRRQNPREGSHTVSLRFNCPFAQGGNEHAEERPLHQVERALCARLRPWIQNLDG